MALSGTQWHSVAHSGTQWQLVAIRGNSWQSVAISGRRTLAARLADHTGKWSVFEKHEASVALAPKSLPDEGGNQHALFSDAHSAMHSACNQVGAFVPKELADLVLCARDDDDEFASVLL